MSLYQYVSKLMPSTEAKAIKENLTLSSERIGGNLLPGLEMLITSLPHQYKWKTPDINSAMTEIVNVVRTHPSLKLPRDASGPEVIRAILHNMTRTIPYVSGEINKTFDNSIFKSGLTFTKATLLQYSETVDFVVSYTSAFMNWLTAVEYNALDGRDRNRGIPPGELEYLLANINNYTLALKIMAYNQDELKKGLRALPQMRIAESAEAEAEQLTLGGGDGNPFGFAQLPWPLSVWYHYRLRRVEAQAQEYEHAEAMERAVAYRIMLIKQKLESGNGDAALEKELQIQEERYNDIGYEISRMKKRYKLEDEA